MTKKFGFDLGIAGGEGRYWAFSLMWIDVDRSTSGVNAAARWQLNTEKA